MINQRIKKVKLFLKKSNTDAILIKSTANVRYLSGFSGEDCYLLITKKNNYFLGDFRYLLQAKKQINSIFEIIETKPTLSDCTKNLVCQGKIRKLNFEAAHFTFAQYQQMFLEFKGIRNLKLVPINNIVENIRQIKDPTEIKLIRKAQAITKKTIKELKPYIKVGRSELKIKQKLEHLLIANGGQGYAFDSIVASGVNSAMPHAQSSKKKIRTREPIIIDSGVIYQGYRSDLTRSFFSCKITQCKDYEKYYKLVATAQDRAIKQIRPNVLASEIALAARRVFREASLEKYFGHALGHGVGLEIHETPSISQFSQQRLVPGMIFSIEPGLYFSGFGGIRIEDLILVTKEGCEIL